MIDTQVTGEDGCYTWTDLEPGHTYAVSFDGKVLWTRRVHNHPCEIVSVLLM